MNGTGSNLLLERMFRARRVVLRAGVVAIGLFAAMALGERLFLLTNRGQGLLLIAFYAALVVMFAGSFATWYYVFRVGLREAGFAYAAGHLAICVVLTFMGFLGILMVPLMVRSDLDRWQLAEVGLPEGNGLEGGRGES